MIFSYYSGIFQISLSFVNTELDVFYFVRLLQVNQQINLNVS